MAESGGDFSELLAKAKKRGPQASSAKLSATSSTEQLVTELQGEVKKLKRELAETGGRGLVKRLKSLEEFKDSDAGAFKKLDKQVDGFVVDWEALEDRVDDLEQNVDDLNFRMEADQKKYDERDAIIAGFDTKIQATERKYNLTCDDAKESYKKGNAGWTSLGMRIDALQAALRDEMKTGQGEVEVLRGQVKAGKAKAAELQAENGELREKVKHLEVREGDLKNKIKNLEQGQARTDRQLAEVKQILEHMVGF